ncbi:hypothetical protein [Myceligenerans pegani]|uniref:Uncharacterized protein n=1 Tax=Myceligenerans pegani TaxID=2776917 RepID=A0ABR9N334_9MICO|nr:hypothetical protein [Myceligenerans sp. TRM 65318]MBE1878056.1 hypothetical protein [Myceligenerans sp. TRM 65318]MBE3020327.1 hypothetical protein [Myceligenerans sp. TRM 65318]
MARKQRKEPELLFSGPPTTDPTALHRALVGATRADVTVGGYLVLAVNSDDDVLDDSTLKRIAVSRGGRSTSTVDTDDLIALVGALRVEEVTDFLCMCMGDYVIEFFDERNTLTEVVRIDLPSGIESRHWFGGARLADPPLLHSWLRSHGFELA